jgi:type II secretory pathway pseudopilin PulG
MREKPSEAGFTLPELIVTGVLLLVILLLSFIFVHPRDYTPQNRNQDRWLGIAHIVQALNRYVADNHTLPDGITDKPQIIGNNATELDLCAKLVPKYMNDMALDPMNGYQVAENTCVATDDSPTSYSSGFTIKKSKNNTVTVTAPYAEGHQDIHIDHTYKF